MDSDSIRKAGDILKSILDSSQNEQAQEYYRFLSAWDEILGDNLAGRARAVELKGKTLIVEVDHPGWIQLLDMRKAHILHQLKERFPALEIEKIRYYVAGESNRSQPAKNGESMSRSEEESPEHSSRDEEGRKEEGKEEADTKDSSKNRLDSVLKRLSGYIEEDE